jgi:hypothetical protein
VPTRLHVLRLYRSALAILVRNARIIVPAVIVATGIPAALELLIEHELSREVGALLTSVVDNFTTAFFAGAAEQLVHRWQEGERHVRIRDTLSHVPPVVIPLFIVAFAQALLVAVGLVLLIVPGLIALTFFAVVGPAVVAENPGIRGAFRRSRQLVRGNAWRVFGVMFSLELLAVLITFAVSAIFSSIGETSDHPLALAIGESLTLPLEVVVVAVMYWRLRDIEARRAAEVEEALAEAPAADPATGG